MSYAGPIPPQPPATGATTAQHELWQSYQRTLASFAQAAAQQRHADEQAKHTQATRELIAVMGGAPAPVPAPPTVPAPPPPAPVPAPPPPGPHPALLHVDAALKKTRELAIAASENLTIPRIILDLEEARRALVTP